ncbi:MAG: bifunctional glutamate N-acetyltransferase/amino-acid acetyltransferase ArgJ [Acidobacteria bacterium]|nr:bifunctional glutamate N-acetyltransferase/amino-acid acetyltransferase ArgJ [Acidobacteriota bacterium]
MSLPLGYKYAATYAGIRKAAKDDLALIVSETACSAAGVFTTNRVQAAPVLLCRSHLKATRGKASALLINAGNANCATRTGMKVAQATSRAVARLLRIPVHQVLPSSTGVIGVELNPDLVTNALPRLVEGLSPDRFPDVANAIMTTDLVPKVSHADVQLDGGTVRISGTTKGSGMIHPGMATTLGYIMTDAAVSAPTCRRLLATANEASYSRITVDGDMSTNDTLILLANGASGVRLTGADYDLFSEALTKLAQDLAVQIARDGEGASKLITIHVWGAATQEDAVRIGRAIGNSPLVKTAIAGSDANWGRIICAAGYSGASFDPSKVDIALQGTQVCRGGLAARFDEADLQKRLDSKDCTIDFRIRGKGAASARFWACDFTEGYIRINGSYRT